MTRYHAKTSDFDMAIKLYFCLKRAGDSFYDSDSINNYGFIMGSIGALKNKIKNK